MALSRSKFSKVPSLEARFWASGSSLFTNGPFALPFQTPFKSGCPSGMRGVACAATNAGTSQETSKIAQTFLPVFVNILMMLLRHQMGQIPFATRQRFFQHCLRVGVPPQDACVHDPGLKKYIRIVHR